MPSVYRIPVAKEIVDKYKDRWTRVQIQDLDVMWFRVVPHDDGTAEVWLSSGEQPPE